MILVQIWWRNDSICVFTKKIQPSHHQICTGFIDMDINWI